MAAPRSWPTPGHRPGSRRAGRLGDDGVARTAGSRPSRVAALDHEVRHDAVPREPVVEALTGEEHEVVDALRRGLGVEGDSERAARGHERRGVRLCRIDRHRRRTRVLLAVAVTRWCGCGAALQQSRGRGRRCRRRCGRRRRTAGRHVRAAATRGETDDRRREHERGLACMTLHRVERLRVRPDLDFHLAPAGEGGGLHRGAPGLWSPNASAYTAFTLGKSVMSATNTSALATWCKVRPQSSRIRADVRERLARLGPHRPRRPCRWRDRNRPVPTGSPIHPRGPPASTDRAGGACGVFSGSTVMCAPSGAAFARRVYRGPGRCQAACPRPGRAHSSTPPRSPRTLRRTRGRYAVVVSDLDRDRRHVLGPQDAERADREVVHLAGVDRDSFAQHPAEGHVHRARAVAPQHHLIEEAARGDAHAHTHENPRMLVELDADAGESTGWVGNARVEQHCGREALDRRRPLEASFVERAFDEYPWPRRTARASHCSLGVPPHRPAPSAHRRRCRTATAEPPGATGRARRCTPDHRRSVHAAEIGPRLRSEAHHVLARPQHSHGAAAARPPARRLPRRRGTTPCRRKHRRSRAAAPAPRRARTTLRQARGRPARPSSSPVRPRRAQPVVARSAAPSRERRAPALHLRGRHPRFEQ